MLYETWLTSLNRPELTLSLQNFMQTYLKLSKRRLKWPNILKSFILSMTLSSLILSRSQANFKSQPPSLQEKFSERFSWNSKLQTCEKKQSQKYTAQTLKNLLESTQKSSTSQSLWFPQTWSSQKWKSDQIAHLKALWIKSSKLSINIWLRKLSNCLALSAQYQLLGPQRR